MSVKPYVAISNMEPELAMKLTAEMHAKVRALATTLEAKYSKDVVYVMLEISNIVNMASLASILEAPEPLSNELAKIVERIVVPAARIANVPLEEFQDAVLELATAQRVVSERKPTDPRKIN